MMNPVPLPGGVGSGPAYDDTALWNRVGAVETAIAGKADIADLASTDNDVHDIANRTGTVEGRVNGLVASKTLLERREHILDCGPASIRKKPSSAILEAHFIPRVASARVIIEVTPGTYVDDPDLAAGGFITLRPTIPAVPVTPSNVVPLAGGAGRDWRAQYTLTAAQAALYQPGDVVHVGIIAAADVTAAISRSLGPGICTAKAGNVVTIRHHAHAQPEYSAAANLRLLRPNIQIRTSKPIEVIGSECVVLDGVGICPDSSSIAAPTFSNYDLIVLRADAKMRMPPGDPAAAMQVPSLVLCAGRIAIQTERGSKIVGAMLSVGGCSGIAMELYPGSDTELFAVYSTNSNIGVRTIDADFKFRRETRESVIGGNLYEGIQAIGGEIYLYGAAIVGNVPDLFSLNNGEMQAPSHAVTVGINNISPQANSVGNNNGYIAR